MIFQTSSRTDLHMKRFRAGILCLAAASVLALGACDSRSTLTPELVVEGLGQPGNPVTNPKDVTKEVCGTSVPCDEAIRADEISIYSFDSKEDAADFAKSLGGNGHQSDWIVLEYEGAAADTDQSKASYASTVDGMWSTD